MKVYLTPHIQNCAIQRIADALERYVPEGIEVVPREADADLVVFYVNGRQDAFVRHAQSIAVARGRRYAMVQLVLRSSMRPEVRGWMSLWLRAAVVWSYLALEEACRREFAVSPSPRFYRAPLGVDRKIFHRTARNRQYLCGTVGASWMTESVREVHLAADAYNEYHYGWHLGSGVPNRIETLEAISDQTLAWMYARTKYVSGLRRCEGFELPAAEGLLCGARPILFNREHYRHWYGEWAEYVEEGSRQEVIDQLVALFRRPYRAVTASERDAAAQVFDWAKVCGGFWERCVA